MGQGYIDIYCERTGPEFWSEPVNALTNLAFAAAAILLARLLLRGEATMRRDYACWGFTALVLTIGIGSGLFHTFARRWALLADVIPIALFILSYTWFALRRFGRLPAWGAGAGVAAVLAIALLVPPLTGFRGGSYVAALLAMLAIGSWLRAVRRHPAGIALLSAAGVFGLSLAMRTADEPVCHAFPVGTHFGWHLLNALVLYLVVRALIRHGSPARTAGLNAPPSPGGAARSP